MRSNIIHRRFALMKALMKQGLCNFFGHFLGIVWTFLEIVPDPLRISKTLFEGLGLTGYTLHCGLHLETARNGLSTQLLLSAVMRSVPVLTWHLATRGGLSWHISPYCCCRCCCHLHCVAARFHCCGRCSWHCRCRCRCCWRWCWCCRRCRGCTPPIPCTEGFAGGVHGGNTAVEQHNESTPGRSPRKGIPGREPQGAGVPQRAPAHLSSITCIKHSAGIPGAHRHSYRGMHGDTTHEHCNPHWSAGYHEPPRRTLFATPECLRKTEPWCPMPWPRCSFLLLRRPAVSANQLFPRVALEGVGFRVARRRGRMEPPPPNHRRPRSPLPLPLLHSAAPGPRPYPCTMWFGGRWLFGGCSVVRWLFGGCSVVGGGCPVVVRLFGGCSVVVRSLAVVVRWLFGCSVVVQWLFGGWRWSFGGPQRSRSVADPKAVLCTAAPTHRPPAKMCRFIESTLGDLSKEDFIKTVESVVERVQQSGGLCHCSPSFGHRLFRPTLATCQPLSRAHVLGQCPLHDGTCHHPEEVSAHHHYHPLFEFVLSSQICVKRSNFVDQKHLRSSFYLVFLSFAVRKQFSRYYVSSVSLRVLGFTTLPRFHYVSSVHCTADSV